jgi:hypothetical protein
MSHKVNIYWLSCALPNETKYIVLQIKKEAI